ncbi:MAG: RNA-binding S4 domain-containing protein [Thioalkalivibrionaceae bacterium]
MLRIDKWLWTARFYKTRALAQRAVQGGKVQVDASRCKASRTLRGGECLRIQRGSSWVEVRVIGFLPTRRPASEACQLYEETEASLAAAEARAKARDVSAGAEVAGSADAAPYGRPDKRARRRIRTFLSQEACSDAPDVKSAESL